MPASLLLIVILVLPFIGALIAAGLPRHARTSAAVLSWIVALISVTCLAVLWPRFQDGEVLKQQIDWLPSLGVNLIIRLDGLSWLFSALILGIGALVVLYARYYMSPKDPVPRFFSFLLAFMGAMQGVVLSGNLIQMVVFWELTSLFSFLLIGYWHQNAAARDGARMALSITATGGVALLVGMILIGRIAGSYELDAVVAARDVILADPLYPVALALILAAALTKSAQFPFHIWLPRAMAAPTPVSAYLHSATMVKAGVFLLMRFWPIFGETEMWYFIVGGAGLTTLLLGAWCAIFQHDLKGLLAYSTISHLGLICLLLGLGSDLGAIAAIFHTVNHATFKASLFMAAGIIDHEAGSRDMRKLSGLIRYMPITATLAMVAAAAMAGVPLLNGFLSKEMFLAEALASAQNKSLNQALPVLATLASAFSVLYSLRFIHNTFFGPPPTKLDRIPHEPPAWMRRPVEVLVALCLVVGVFPAVTVGPFLRSAAVSMLGFDLPYYSLSVWHGFNLPLLLGVIAMAGGIALYVVFGRALNANPRGGPWGMKRLNGGYLFERSMALLLRVSETVQSRLGTRRLQPQLRVIVLTALLAGGAAATTGFVIVWPEFRPPQPHNLAFAALWLVGGVCAVAAAWQAKYHRLAAVALMSGAGLASCLTFVWLSAPDLALTQLVVEVVTTVLLLLGLRWLPKRLEEINVPEREQRRARWRRRLDRLIAVAAGAGVAVLSWTVMVRPPVEGLSRFFVERAYSDAGGRNVVNVILVDFRAFDTFGEITVLGVVGLTVLALLRRFRPASDSLTQPMQKRVQDESDRLREGRTEGDTLKDTMMIPGVVMRWMFPFIILLAVHLFLRGHDLPGGGFAAGVALSIAFILQYMVSGARWVEERLAIRPILWIGVGLMLAALSGAGSWLFGHPFLTTYFQYTDLPLLGRVPLATAVLFDLGVVILVVGATVLILVALAHQSLRKARVDEAAAGAAAVESSEAGEPS
ncbi:monovalent cation/H+ antiporter subunit A [Brevundimonas naejangsanensis]|uniref:Monovalent cation/H+ antiporter subunit A n=1 Tax=Brevundimonas naejangsanensis TaxID=588932 RepID=A0A494RF49_9CAUL|nr:monovalent cation/H+ antiporter subunit A [Brevundimonas naejangsanensis]AYG94821.1 monovalent cation/H+ antiporter subunit A [Brevundimonas naejangsanensis]